MSMNTAVIIGAGIAGPALGIALQRAGFEPVVCEASTTPRDDIGAFLNLAPNGINALRTLGLDHIIDGLGFQNDRLVFHNEAGRVLTDAAVGGVTIMRGALSGALRDAAERAGVRFEFGKALTSIDECSGGVVARFADGTTKQGRVLLGADGIHSRTRHSHFADAPTPTYTGIINLGGVVRSDLPPTGTAMHMIFGRRSFFGTPCGRGARLTGSATSPSERNRRAAVCRTYPRVAISANCSPCIATIHQRSAVFSKRCRARSVPTRCTTFRLYRPGTVGRSV